MRQPLLLLALTLLSSSIALAGQGSMRKASCQEFIIDPVNKSVTMFYADGSPLKTEITQFDILPANFAYVVRGTYSPVRAGSRKISFRIVTREHNDWRDNQTRIEASLSRSWVGANSSSSIGSLRCELL